MRHLIYCPCRRSLILHLSTSNRFKHMPLQIDKPSIPERHCERNLFAWSFLAGLTLFAGLAGPFFAGRIYCRDDLGCFHLPIRAFYARQIALGQAFDWMPQLFSGFYLTGEGQAGMYHPVHLLLYRLLPFQAAIDCEYLLSYPFMLAGMWLFLRRRISNRTAAMLGGVFFTFCGFNLLHFIHPNAVAIVAHIPWLLWTIDIVLTDFRRIKVYSALAATAILTGSQLLLGYPQYVWFSLLTEFVYAVYVLIDRRNVPRVICRADLLCRKCIGCRASTWPELVLAKIVGLFIGGAQLLPTVDALMHSSRQASGAFSSTGSLHPSNLLQLAAPYLFVNRVVGQNTHEFGLYLGAVPLMLIVWLVMCRGELGVLRSLALAASLIGLLALLLALGEYGPVHQLPAYVPVLKYFRFPARYAVIFELAAAILAALGFLLLMRANLEERRRRHAARAFANVEYKPLLSWRRCLPLWIPAAFSAAVAVLGMAYHDHPYIAPSCLMLIGPVLFAAAALLIYRAARGSFAALVSLIIIAALDLGTYGLSYSVYPYCPKMNDYIAGIQTPPEAERGRLLASLYHYDEPGLRTGDQIVLRGWSRADGYAGLEPQRLLNYGNLSALRVAGVGWVRRGLTTSDIAGLIPRGDNWSQVPNPLPRVRLVDRIIASNDPAADIAKIDIDTEALSDVALALPPAKPGTASIVEDIPGRLSVRTEAQSVQLLVFAESYHPGWKAVVDGSPVQVYRVNGDFMGCLVGRGTQLAAFEFKPASLHTGRLISYLGLGFLPFCLIGIWRKPVIFKS